MSSEVGMLLAAEQHRLLRLSRHQGNMAGPRTHQERQVAYECIGYNVMCGFDEA